MKSSVREILDKPYARILLRNDDGSYTAQILEFPGCVAEGDTPDDAMNDLDHAASSWIEVAIEQNEDIPKPLASYGYSGKINLRLPKSLHKQSARYAKRDDISLNQFFISAIAARVGAEDFCDRLTERIDKRWDQHMASCSVIVHMHQVSNSVNMFGQESSFNFFSNFYHAVSYTNDELTKNISNSPSFSNKVLSDG